MFQLELVTTSLPLFLNQGLLVVFLLLLDKDGLEELIARNAIHIEDLRRDNILYL